MIFTVFQFIPNSATPSFAFLILDKKHYGSWMKKVIAVLWEGKLFLMKISQRTLNTIG